jgi:hypothetical protein
MHVDVHILFNNGANYDLVFWFKTKEVELQPQVRFVGYALIQQQH